MKKCRKERVYIKPILQLQLALPTALLPPWDVCEWRLGLKRGRNSSQLGGSLRVKLTNLGLHLLAFTSCSERSLPPLLLHGPCSKNSDSVACWC